MNNNKIQKQLMSYIKAARSPPTFFLRFLTNWPYRPNIGTTCKFYLYRKMFATFSAIKAQQPLTLTVSNFHTNYGQLQITKK